MNITMFTNTYLPHVGGVANSVKLFTEEYRRCGHKVLVIAPVYENMPLDEEFVMRVPAIRNFNNSGFSLCLPVTGFILKKIKHFKPDIIHSHHPYLLGDVALRMAASIDAPLIFTYHTMYEEYTHYVPGNFAKLKHFIIGLAAGYANMCDHLIAPSESILTILQKRKVKTSISIIPTGIDIKSYQKENGSTFCLKKGIPPDAFIIGYVGRLAPEKNLEFWAKIASEFVKIGPKNYALVAGTGPLKEKIQEIFSHKKVADRLCFEGVLTKDLLIQVYKAMDVLLFTSKSETQGIVLLEAMAAKTLVIALDASGVREIVRDRKNGLLLKEESVEAFIKALSWISSQDTKERNIMKKMAQMTAQPYSIQCSVQKALALYQDLIDRKKIVEKTCMRKIKQEKMIWNNRFTSLKRAIWE